MGGQLPCAAPSQYARWQRWLSEYFWKDRSRPVVMFVDDDELRRVAPDLDDPAASLAEAVWGALPARPSPSMFEQVERWQDRWCAGDRAEPPPTLPVLALSVLAATRMHSDENASSNNYYWRLANAMRPSSSPDRVSELAAVLAGEAFVPVAEMWRVIDEWVLASGIVSTIREHWHWTRIGFPLSQALVRRSDRALLTQFFAAVELGPGRPELPAADLMSLLKLWAARPRGLSDTFCRALESVDLLGLLESVVSALAASWDGTVITQEGVPRLGVRLVLDLDRWSAKWSFPVVAGVDQDRLSGLVDGSRREIEISHAGNRTHYSFVGEIPVSAAALADGFRLVGSELTAELAPHQLAVFAEDPDTAGWESVASPIPYTEHVLAVAPSLTCRVEEVLEQAADRGWRVVRQGHRALLSGWTIFERVVLADRDALAAALGRVPGMRASGLSPELTTRPRLAAGLPLARALNSNAYLLGGTPDLLLPAGGEPRHVQAALDGREQSPPFLAAGFPIELRRIAPDLGAGSHEVVVDNQRLTFTLIERMPGPGVPPCSIGWNAVGDVGDNDTHGSSRNVRSEPVLLRRGRDETWLLLRDGQCNPVLEPAVPLLYERHLPDVSTAYFEFAPAEPPAWVAQRRGERWEVRRATPQPPGFRALNEPARLLWQRVARHGPVGDRLWQAYVSSWEAMRDR